MVYSFRELWGNRFSYFFRGVKGVYIATIRSKRLDLFSHPSSNDILIVIPINKKNIPKKPPVIGEKSI